ncbi:peptidyl-tRNA hydrolase 2, mitochondrial [Teleopsis dalmanni]|uniref:peptidyl-tRNA hydrolase 2, mitochondrial n=1 Tax=Teleopsis dalmanni TaxID=139649 RepID=UPI0018CD6F98|nr:peptidyl-tRNA hydrolase 2, mitochondrial [Teleopsis dalmanni]
MLLNIIKRAFNGPLTPRTKLALVVRGDIKMSKGKTAAQCAHAAIMCYQEAQNNNAKQQLLNAWTYTGQPKIVLRINSYEDIIALQKQAANINVVAAVVKDAGHTELAPGTPTVLGVGPDTVERIDKLVAHLKLL